MYNYIMGKGGNMFTVGITGSSGSGKGYVCEVFNEAGIPCLDTDKVCREVYLKGHECYDDLIKEFGTQILGEDGEIDRKALFNLTFSDQEKYSRLNTIAFMHILNETRAWLKEREKEDCEIAVIDAPMLYESGFDQLCDRVVCVICDRRTQIRRIMFRDGISERDAEIRLDKQRTNLYYTSRAHHVIDNSVNNEVNVDSETRRLIGNFRRFVRKNKKLLNPKENI